MGQDLVRRALEGEKLPTDEQVAQEIRGLPKTAKLEELEALLKLQRERYSEFLRNNPSLQDPLVRQRLREGIAPQYPHGSPASIPASRHLFSARVTDAAFCRMLRFEIQIEGLLKAIDESKTQAPRRGYRVEVKKYMEAKGLATIPEAARHLGISIDTLKTIMSTKGKLRCSAKTQEEVLSKIALPVGN